MKRFNTLLIVLIGALLCVPSLAFARGPLSAPTIVEGQYVYTIPASFDPPLINQRGIDQINQTAAGLRYPFYVVLVETLPGSGNEDTRAAAASDGLAADWSDSSDLFDVSTSQIIVLTYNPRKLAFLAGAKFKSELGFEGRAHDPYLKHFDDAVAGTPKDPKGGIIATMKAVDAYLWDQTDPVRIAQRAEQVRQRQQADLLRTAQSGVWHRC